MRKLLLPALLLACASSFSPAQTSAKEKIASYFRGWYAYVPGSEVTVKPSKDVVLPGFEAYMVERHSSSKSHQEANLVLYDVASGEIFVGEVFADPERARSGQSFDAGRDLPNVEASLREVFGVPVKVKVGSAARGLLLPLTAALRIDREGEVSAARTGYISQDGSALMLGEFRSPEEGSRGFRETLLSQSEGVRAGQGRFTVTEFLDFQCDRCRIRTPEVRRAVEQKGGTVEVRFLPLVKTHEWAFAAAESAAALAGVKPELYRRYEEAMFARGEGMSPSAARELAADIAEAAGAREAFTAEISSGRAKARVARDVALAMRLGIVSTPSFVYRGTYLPGERGVLETYLWEGRPAAGARPAPHSQ